MRIMLKPVAGVLLVILSFSMFLQIGCNCQSQETTPTQTATVEKSKSFIWKISSATSTVYLLGSVHVASQDLYPLDNTIEDAFESADYLVVEVNTNNINQENSFQLLMKYGTYPQGDGFKKNVPEDLYNSLNEQFEKYGIGLALMDDYRPFVIYNVMSQFMLESLGYKIEYGIDLYFMDKAEKSNIIILELETAEFQMDLLSSIPDEIMIMALQYDINNPETSNYLQELFSAWVNGDAQKMETIVFEALVEEPDMAPYFEKLYDQRNVNMAQKIEEYLADDEIYFIVVGAGHLVGENGLINLLKNQGYDIEQLENSN